MKRQVIISISATWGCAFLLLFFYYFYIAFPMERSFIKGLSYARENKQDQMMDEFNKVMRVYPNYEPVYLNLADLYRKNGQPEKMLESYRQARKISVISSEDMLEHRALGIVYTFAYTRHDLDKAMALYNDCVIKNYFSLESCSYEGKQ